MLRLLSYELNKSWNMDCKYYGIPCSTSCYESLTNSWSIISVSLCYDMWTTAGAWALIFISSEYPASPVVMRYEDHLDLCLC